MELRPYQHQVVSDLRQAIAEGHKRVVLQLATGAGKTRVAADIIERAIAKGKRVQFMAPRRELIFQSRDAFRALGIEAGVIMAGEELFPSQVYVTSFDTLHSRAALRFKMKWPESDLVIADEAHLALSKSRKAILSRYPIVIGLTATPALPGGKGLGSFFTKMVTGPPISELQRDGHLVPVSYMAPSKPDLEGIKVVKGDYVVDQLGMVMDKPKLVGDIVDHWLQFANNRPTVVYAVNRRHGRHLCEAFCAKGVEAEYVDGETDNKERKAILERVSSGKTRVLCNVFVASYGLDIPSLEVCVLARPTKSVVLYFQTIGRVLRPSPGKEGALVIDHAGAWYEHGAVEDRVPWDLDPGSSVSERIKKAREETKAPKQLVCPQCKTGFTARRSCPACGYELIPPTEAIPVYEGKLIEVKNSWAKDKQKVYSELLGLAQEKERSTGWVAHAYKKLFGVWPKGLAPQPLIACPDLRRWVKGQDARFAIAKARGRKRA